MSIPHSNNVRCCLVEKDFVWLVWVTEENSNLFSVDY